MQNANAEWIAQRVVWIDKTKQVDGDNVVEAAPAGLLATPTQGR